MYLCLVASIIPHNGYVGAEVWSVTTLTASKCQNNFPMRKLYELTQMKHSKILKSISVNQMQNNMQLSHRISCKLL